MVLIAPVPGHCLPFTSHVICYCNSGVLYYKINKIDKNKPIVVCERLFRIVVSAYVVL